MSLEKPIEEIVEADLRDLIENKVSERKTVEYKQALLGKSDGDKKEFLADVSSFANASGGHLVYGMKEEGDVPVELCGMEIADPGSAVSALDNSIRDGIRPRIPGFVVHLVPLSSGRTAIVIHVPKSYASPHMVTFGGSSKFFARNSNGKHQLDVDEIRSAFLLSENIAERIRQFRLDRIAKIMADETPVPLRKAPKLVLHVVPLAGLVSPPGVDLRSAPVPSTEMDFRPMSTDDLTWESRFNFDGFVLWYGSRSDGPVYAYTQIFRNGALETVDTSLKSGIEGRLNGEPLERNVARALTRYIASLPRIGVSPPLALMLTLVGVGGLVARPRDTLLAPWDQGVVGRFDRDVVAVPEVLAEGSEADVAALMRPAFDMIWNAAGWARCPYPLNG